MGQAASEQMNDPQRHQGHETSGNQQSQRDGRQSVAQADVQKGRNQSPGPGSGPRQGDGHEQHQPQQTVFPHQTPLQVGPALQGINFRSEEGVLPQPVKASTPAVNTESIIALLFFIIFLLCIPI